STTAHLLRELATTLVADTHLAAAGTRTATELIDLDYAQIEGEMSGHPWIVFNKGRVGFAYDDELAYAPESRRPVRLHWVAARLGRASYQAVEGLGQRTLLEAELGADTVEAFSGVLRERGEDPADFVWFPVHEWQWSHVVIPLFAAEVATGDLIPLGPSPDRYLPQQSIRTFSNHTTPHRHHVKLAMSILNTLVYRGLPSERTVAAPAVTAFVQGIRDRDPFLRDQCRLILLGEVASVDVPHRHFDALPGAPYQFHELLGCIWRQSIHTTLDPGERALTMAALLHVDRHGRPLVAALVERSGMAARDWLVSLFDAILPPLLHYLYRYGTVFSPHGENAILVHREGIPARLAIKDFVDDVNISDLPLPELADLPETLRRVLLTEPPHWICQFLQAGLFVGHLRYLSDLVEDHLGVGEHEFWALVRATVIAYQERFAERAERFATFDLLAPDFERICLNRNRLLLNGYADRPERPHAATHGRVPNPLHEVI
ncbi:MAG: hypothetical protein GEU81_18105, partial [Nitriliruptorales bacterium]|nr:hypothetical protein [Nitriliruptorales bacterium]